MLIKTGLKISYCFDHFLSTLVYKTAHKKSDCPSKTNCLKLYKKSRLWKPYCSKIVYSPGLVIFFPSSRARNGYSRGVLSSSFAFMPYGVCDVLFHYLHAPEG